MNHNCERLSIEPSIAWSRRSFAKSVLAAAAATQCGLFEFASTLFAETAPKKLKARVQVIVARPKEHKDAINWPGGQVDIVAMQDEFTKTLADAAAALGVQLDVRSTPMSTEGELKSYLDEVKATPPDGILVLAMDLNSSWRKIVCPLVKGRGDIPTIVYSNMSTFTQHQQEIRDVPVTVLAATQEVGWLKEGLRMFHTMVQMKNMRIALVCDRYKDKTPLRVWKGGPEFHYVAEQRWDDEVKKLDFTPEMRAMADHYAKNAQQIVEPKPEDILKAAKVYVALRRLMQLENCQGITCNCLPFAKRTGDTACLSYCRMMDEGIVGCCEADLGGATLMALSHLLLDRPGFINDPMPNTVNNTLLASHCTTGLKLKGYGDAYRAPYLLRDYHIRSGVAVQVLWPVDSPVTIMEQAGESLLVGTGRVVSNVPNPPSKQWGGCRSTVEIKMNDCADSRDVLGFHQMVVCGDFQRTLELYAELTGMAVKPIVKAIRPKSDVSAVSMCPCQHCGAHA